MPQPESLRGDLYTRKSRAHTAIDAILTEAKSLDKDIKVADLINQITLTFAVPHKTTEATIHDTIEKLGGHTDDEGGIIWMTKADLKSLARLTTPKTP